jgi:hypothetical protein
VEVSCAGGQAGGTLARVTFALTALSPAGREKLGGFQRGFAELMKSWERDIARALGRAPTGSPPRP